VTAERARSAIPPEATLRGPTLPALVAFCALVSLAFASGGFFPRAWTAAAVALLAVLGVALAAGRRAELGKLEVAWLGLLAALTGWTALSLVWSANRHATLLEVRRDLVYLAAAGALLALARPASVGDLVLAMWAAVVVVVAVALVRYLVAPGFEIDEVEGQLLFRPLGYANALGILTGMGGIVAVYVVARPPTRALRALAAASAAPLAAALYLTSSRASVLAVAVGLGVMVALERDRPALVGAVVVIAPGAAVAAWLCERAGLLGAVTADAETVRDGRLLALWVAIVAVALAAAAPLAPRLGTLLARARAASGVALAALVVAGAAAAVAARGHHLLAEGYRPSYWRVAWHEYVAHPWLGSAAGTFGDWWTRSGLPSQAGGALDAHNLYLETLAELGPLGLALLAAVLLVPLAAGLVARRRPFVAAAAGAYVALLAHAALDWDWEMPAVMLSGFVCAAALVVAAREERGRWEPSARARLAAVVLVLALAAFALAAQLA
jgi:O-antigen ligase